MPKINVDIDNIKTLKHEAKLFCEIAHALFGGKSLSSLTTDKVLTGVSKKLGYSSYGGIVACNQKSHSYVPLSLSDITHFRYVASSIAQETGASEYVLLVVASFLQLGVQTIKQIAFFKAPESGKAWTSLVIADRNRYNPLMLVLSSPKSLLVARVATTLKNMQVWLPELVDFLKQELDANDECVILTPMNKLWNVTSALDVQLRPIGYVEIVTFDGSANKSRRFYDAIFSDDTDINAVDIYKLAKEICEYLADIIDIDIDEAIFPDKRMDPEAWLVSFQNNLTSSGLGIRFCIRLDPHLTNCSLFTSSVEIKESENVVMQFLHRNQLITSPGLLESVFEMRQVANRPYLEAWIVPEVSHNLIELHTRIHEEKMAMLDGLGELDNITVEYWLKNGNCLNLDAEL